MLSFQNMQFELLRLGCLATSKEGVIQFCSHYIYMVNATSNEALVKSIHYRILKAQAGEKEN
jgi:hypothetical protein